MLMANSREKIRRYNRLAIIIGILFSFATAYSANQEESSSNSSRRDSLDFTAYTLQAGQFKLGLTFDAGLNDRLSLGTDMLSSLAGAPNLRLKTLLYDGEVHAFSFAIAATYLNRRTAFWGIFREHFDDLDVRVLQPQFSWSQIISQRLILHSHWSLSLGPTRARLSEKGIERYQKSKYPTVELGDTPANQAANYTLPQRTLQIQSLLGLSRDLFQLTGEIQREDKNKSIYLTSRIEQLALEDLRAKSIRLTAAQQWQFESFSIRLGAGLAYLVFSGRDLDQEEINEAGWQPVADLDFYWLF